MKKKKYLPLYTKWAKNGYRLPSPGLCASLPEEGKWQLDELFYPRELIYCTYWASPYRYRYSEPIAQMFTPLRQNIVLFLAAMNNEL